VTTVAVACTTNMYALTVVKEGNGIGTVTSSPSGIDCGVDCSKNYSHDTSVTLTANAAAGSQFFGWSGCDSTSGTTCTVTMTTAKSVTAAFTLPLAVSVSSLDFGDQRVSVASGNLTVTLKNNSSSQTSLNPVLAGTHEAQFSRIAGGCGSTLAAGASCDINLQFSPTSDGEKLAYLKVEHGLADSPWLIALSGYGRELKACDGASATSSCPAISELDLGATQSGVATNGTFTLHKVGSGNVTVKGVVLLGESRDQFAIGSHTCSNLPCNIPVSFMPTAFGAVSATLLVNYESGMQPLRLRIAGRSGLSPSNMQFGNQSPGATQVPQTVTVSNSGTSTMSVTSVSLSGDDAAKFSFTNNCTAAVPVGGTCTVDVRFTPPNGGPPQSAALNISTQETIDGVVKVASYVVPLAGKPTTGGSIQQITLDASVLSFNDSTVNPISPEIKSVTISNPGTETLALNRFDVGGTDSSHFAISSETCPVNLAAGTSCVVNIRFSPTVAGPKSAWLAIQHDATGSASLVTLVGVATGGSAESVPSRSTLQFGSQLVGAESTEQFFTLSNKGSAAMMGLSVATSGGNASDFIINNQCSASLPALRICRVGVRFKPSATGSRSTSLQITATGLPTTTIALKGVTPGSVLNDGGSSNIASTPEPSEGFDYVSDISTRSSDVDDPILGATASLQSDSCGIACASVDSAVSTWTIDSATSSVYAITRDVESSAGAQQNWTLQYRSNTGALFGKLQLPSTAEVLWRGPGLDNTSLPTTAWTAVCGSRVWAIQDGYQLLYRSADHALAFSRNGELSIGGGAEVTLIEEMQCAASGGVHIEGFVFGISGFDPPLHDTPVSAERFRITLDAWGRSVDQSVDSAEFDVTAYCRSSSSEQIAYCEAARRALGQ